MATAAVTTSGGKKQNRDTENKNIAWKTMNVKRKKNEMQTILK